MNDLTWIDPTLLLTAQKNPFPIKQTLNTFFEKFETPLKWINSSEKNVKVNNSSSEFGYILYWINQKLIWQYEEYRVIIINYILANTLNHSLSNIPLLLGLLSNEEINKIKSVDSGISISKIGAMCILLNKPLKDFTDSEIESFTLYDNFFQGNNFSKKRLYSLRVALGYSNKIVSRNSRQTNWDLLCSNERYGSIFKEYKNILIASNAKKKYLSTTSLALTKLLNFMKTENLKSFEFFNATIFESLIDYISTEVSPQSATVLIPKIKHFFLVNIGENMFPKEFDFCDTFWSAFTRKMKQLNKEQDGHAFSDVDLPQKIINVLIKFTPNDEIEYICKEFWLIIATCPVRFSYLKTLDAKTALQRMPNNPNAYGLYSPFRDKAGNRYGQFPLMDKIGLNAVKRLQERAESLKLQPLYNKEVDATFVHLFQLTTSPWILSDSAIRYFYNHIIMKQIKLDYPNDAELRASAHSFRHFLITHVAMKTGDETVCQTAAGHRDVKMTRTYLRSKASKNSLLLRVIDKYEKQEITGMFYLKLVALLTSDNAETEHILFSVSNEMRVDNFFQKYGKKTNIGYCFSNKECSTWNACWGCNNFIMTKNEITEAIKILCYQIVTLKSLTSCIDFSYEIPSIKNKLKLISLIIKRLTELGLSEEQINIMTGNYFNNIDIMTGVE